MEDNRVDSVEELSKKGTGRFLITIFLCLVIIIILVLLIAYVKDETDLVVDRFALHTISIPEKLMLLNRC